MSLSSLPGTVGGGSPPTIDERQLSERPSSMQINASIFKAYDIRGVVPSTINEEVAVALGKAFGTIALSQGETTVAVGRDGRLSGPSLSAALVRGLICLLYTSPSPRDGLL